MNPTGTATTRSLPRRACAGFGAAALAVLLLVGCGADTTLRGAVIEPLPSVGSLTLPEATKGAPFALTPARGGVLLMYFGYTHCPDVCPTSLAHVKAALRRIGEKRAERVSLAFATVDPDRDTGALLQSYVRSFVPTATALRTTDDVALRKVADAFGVQYSVTKKDNGDVEVAHTGTLYAIDDQGRLAVQWTFDADPKEATTIAHDLGVLLRRKS